MATAPSLEEILLQAHKMLGLKVGQTSKNKKFLNIDMSTENYSKMVRELLGSIFDSLDFNDEKQAHAVDYIFNQWFIVNKKIELSLWTHSASKQRVVWFLLAYVHIPFIARMLAFWNLDNSTDKDMPNAFWFLPNPVEKSGSVELSLPVAQVINWWLDLLDQPMDKVKDYFKQNNTRIESDSVERTINNWKDKNTLPDIATIEQYFSNKQEFEYKGCYANNKDDDLIVQFESAMSFLRNEKELNKGDVVEQLSLNEEAINQAFSHNSSDAIKNSFIEAVKIRYSPPKTSTIKRHLLIARFSQSIYQGLLKWLFPNVSEKEASVKKNKLLELVTLYKRTYNLTIEATLYSDNEDVQNRWFDEKLQGFEKIILPVKTNLTPKELESRFQNLSRHLFYVFEFLSDSNELNSHYSTNPIQYLKEAQMPHDFTECKKIWQRLEYILVEKQYNTSSKLEVAGLLKKIKKNIFYKPYQGVFLYYEALHCLASNKFGSSSGQTEMYFNKALKAAKEYNYGELRGDIAKKTLALLVSYGRLNIVNHEKYYRNYILYTLDNSVSKNLEDTSIELYEYFWNNLYKPYPQEIIKKQVDFKSYIGAIIGGEQTFDAWINDNKKLSKEYIRDVRGDSYLLSIMKIYRGHQNNNILNLVKNEFKYAVITIIKEWKNQINLIDFKRQSPLILASDWGNVELMKLLIDNGADVNAQDMYDRTPLHAACACHSNNAAKLLLQCDDIDLSKVASDKNTVLHTAVFSGLPDIVEILLNKYPQLLQEKNTTGRTPIQRLEYEVLNDFERYKQFINEEHNRKFGDIQDFLKIQEILNKQNSKYH